MRFSLMLLSTLAVFSTANASQYFWQAAPEKNVIIPRLDYILSSKVDSKAGGYTKTKGGGIDLGYERGLNEQFALGVSTDYSFLKQEDETGASAKQKGLGDIVVHLKGTSPMEKNNLKYGADLSISLKNSETKTNGDSNNYSGRQAITPYVGFETTAGELTFGGKLAYLLALTDIKDETSGTTTKYSGAETLAIEGFLESTTAVGNFGGKLGYSKTSDTKNKSTGTKSENASVWTLGAYGTRTLNETTDLTFGVDYAMSESTKTNKSGDAVAINIGARFTL